MPYSDILLKYQLPPEVAITSNKKLGPLVQTIDEVVKDREGEFAKLIDHSTTNEEAIEIIVSTILADERLSKHLENTGDDSQYLIIWLLGILVGLAVGYLIFN